MTPATVVHELGHSVVCAGYGYEQSIHIDALGASSYCYSSEMGDSYLFKAFGGLLASIVMLAPMASYKVRRITWIAIPLVVLGVSHAINAFIETAFYDFYITDNSILPQLLMMISLVLFFGLLIKYGRV